MNESRRGRNSYDNGRGYDDRRGPAYDDNRKKKKKGGAAAVVVIVIAAVVLVVSLMNIVSLVGTDMASTAVYDGMRAQTAVRQGETEEEDELLINFAALKEMNDEVAAWIIVPGTPVDYPVMYADNNKYYLTHSADNTENRNGAVFIDEINQPDFSDQNTVLYGHNMRSGQMFARLHDFEKEEFFEAHPNFYIYTPDGKKRTYRIFGVYETKSAGKTYDISFADGDAFNKYIEEAREKSLYQRDVEIAPDDKLVTLSTCVKDARQNRLVLQGVLVDEKDIV